MEGSSDDDKSLKVATTSKLSVNDHFSSWEMYRTNKLYWTLVSVLNIST